MTMTETPPTTEHNVRTTSVRGAGYTRRWFATCSCGERSGPLTTAGMAAGWDARHREEHGEL
jgi:hypothetical protein